MPNSSTASPTCAHQNRRHDRPRLRRTRAARRTGRRGRRCISPEHGPRRARRAAAARRQHSRLAERRFNKPIAILVDLAGPKIRLGDLPDDHIFCNLGDEFSSYPAREPQRPNELTSTYAPLVEELANRRPRDAGRWHGQHGGRSPKSPIASRLRVVQRGTIRSRQGINLPGVKLSAPAMSATDREHAIWAAKAGIDFVGLSFVRSPDDVQILKGPVASRTARRLASSRRSKNAKRSTQLEEIITAADAVMVARGDLGVEIDVAQMPIEQKRIIAMCHRFQRPVIIATQMLDSMQDSPRPTRAEATDVANAILDGADACMLSGETAVGNFPLEAVEMMNRIALATETTFQRRPPRSCRKAHFPSCTTSREPSCAPPAKWRTTWMRSSYSSPAIQAARHLRSRNIAATCRRSASARARRRCGRCACTGA